MDGLERTLEGDVVGACGAVVGVRHHYPGLCHGCAAAPTQQRPLQRCAQCHLVMYCSRECQRSDWHSHRPFCVAHKMVKGRDVLEEAAAVYGQQQLQQQRELLGGLRMCASLAMGRRLWPHEEEVLLYPRLCEVCGERGVTGPGAGCCTRCHCVYYCCDHHRAKDGPRHGRWCRLYWLCVLCDRRPSTATLALPPTLDQEYRPLAPTMTAHLTAALGREGAGDPDLLALLSQPLSFPLTALYVLQCVWPGLSKAGRITLHVVGAEDGREPSTPAHWEYLLHRLPHLTHLNLLLVGPNLAGPEGCREAPLCRRCRAEGRVLLLEGRRALYHHLAVPAPHARLAFNCGFHEWAGEEGDTWPASLAVMARDNTPLAFTSYSRAEAERDLAATRRAGPAVRVVMAGPNPYHSLRPLRDWTRDEGNQLYHNNQYLTVVQGGGGGEPSLPHTP